MIVGNTHSLVCVVVDRHEVQRGRWDGRRALDLAIYLGPLGLHLFWPGVRASYVRFACGGGA